jgi:hypothetical protein
MKNKLIICVILIAVMTLKVSGQATTEEKPAVKISGYVRSETFYDTYLSTETRDGELYYYPKRKDLDKSGTDKNAISQFEMLGLQSRVKVGITGGSAMGAKLSGMIETDFNGSSDAYKFNLRLRHAIIKMDWEKTQVLIGQYWHPTVISELAPNTVLFGSGVVFHPLNRPTQIRVTYTLSPNFKLMGAIASYALHRPIEPSGTNTQRNSGLPEMDIQAQVGNVNSAFFSFTAGYKFLRPYLTTPNSKIATTTINKDSIFASTQNVGSYHISATAGYTNASFSVKAQCNYGENLTFLNMIGGYAPVKGSKNAQGEYDYTNMKTVALWTDLETKGSKVRFGLFAGFTKNLGTNDSVEFVNKKFDDKLTVNTKTDLCRDADLSVVYRIAPRVYFIRGPVDIGFEYILTGANYGTFSGMKIIDVKDKSINHRILLSVRYTF